MRITRTEIVVLAAIVAAGGLALALSHAPLRGHAGEAARLSANEAYGRLPLSFEINQGQTDASVKFLSRGIGYNLFLTSTDAVLSLERGTDSTGSEGATLRMKLVGANPAPEIHGFDRLPGNSNYFIGNDPKEWRVDVSTFARVHYGEVYPGVDVVYYGNQRKLENDFIVAPGVNPGVITLAYDGANRISIDKEGSLVLAVASGDVRLQKPVIYQIVDGERREVAGKYVLRNPRNVGFEVAAYDLAKPLVIDPVLVYSSYLGGNGTDEGYAIAVDFKDPFAENVYVTGRTSSTNFPGANNPLQHGFDDVFVAKFNTSASALVYSTYLGGSNSEAGFDIAVDYDGGAYITGKTASPNFPVVNALRSTYSGGTDEDAFVTRLNPSGSALVYSTYLAGQFGARGWGIAASSSQGYAYVTGTTSIGFPVTSGAFEAINYNSGFLTKLCTNCSGASSLVYSTFLAHTGAAEGRAVAADVAGNVYVVGNLNSTAINFATTGAAQTLFGGGSADAFVEKFNTNLSGAASRVYATYLGGIGKDIGGSEGSGSSGRAIAIDDSGNAYVTGATVSANFPLVNAYQSILGGQEDAFLTKLNASGSALLYSTFLGGSGDDLGRSVAVNVAGSAYVTGVAGPNFPTVNGLLTPAPGFGFVTRFTPSGTAVAYSTLLPGVSYGSFSIAVDFAGNAFATGSTNANIVTAFPIQPANGGGGTDGWVSVVADPTVIGRVSDENGNPLSGAAVNLTGGSAATTDANGGYTFGLLTAGSSYTVAVAAPGYIFASSGVSNLVKNVRRDFSPAVSNIVGQVTLENGGLRGVTVTLGGGKSMVTQTDANGFYSFNNLPSGRNYTVTPSMNGLQFTPPGSAINNVLTDQTANFSGLTVQLTLTGGGATTASTTGTANIVSTGYATASLSSGAVPFGTAVFSLSQNGYIVSEAGVPASPPTLSARIFIDYRTGIAAGAGKLDINTGLAIANRSASTASLTYLLRDAGGQMVATGHGTLQPKAHTAKFIHELKDIAPDFNLPANFSTATLYGSLEITSSQLVSVLGLRLTTNQRGETLLTSTSVADLSRGLTASPVYFPQLADGGGYTTSVFLSNTSTSTQSGTMNVFDDTGAPLIVQRAGGTAGSAFSYSIPAAGTFIFQTDGSPVSTRIGWIQVNPSSGNTAPVGAGVFSFSPQGILVTESGIPSATPTTRARLYVDKSGGHDTGIAIANPGGAAGSVTVQTFELDGTTAAGSGIATLDLAANGHKAAFAGEMIGGLASGFTGVAELTSNSPFVALTLRSLTNGRGDFLLTTFPVADSTQAAPSPIVFPQIADGDGYSTQFIFISAGGAASVAVVFIGNDGLPVGIGHNP